MLTVRHLDFQYSSSAKILNKLSFQAESGEFVSVLGESGSGKSTLLKLIYGLEDISSGEIKFENKKIGGPKFNLVPGHPEIKFVPQEFDLLDYVTVAENVGKYLSNFDLPRKKESIERALQAVKMQDFRDELPTKLSGGQRQRVSIARAIATNPKMLLLDEPYSHLDQPLKFEIRKNIRNWAKETDCTVILTTHDAQDALGFSDKIIILKSGKIIQEASPENLRNFPENEYVASLLGEYSVLNSTEMRGLFQIEIPNDKKAVIYPEEIAENENGIEFRVIDTKFQGRDYLAKAETGMAKLKFYSSKTSDNQLVRLKIQNYHLI